MTLTFAVTSKDVDDPEAPLTDRPVIAGKEHA